MTIKDALLEAMQDCDGVEVHRADWSVAEAIVAEGLGTLGGARGPGGDWRRLEPIEAA